MWNEELIHNNALKHSALRNENSALKIKVKSGISQRHCKVG